MIESIVYHEHDAPLFLSSVFYTYCNVKFKIHHKTSHCCFKSLCADL